LPDQAVIFSSLRAQLVANFIIIALSSQLEAAKTATEALALDYWSRHIVTSADIKYTFIQLYP
jgi:hypothetical protein